MSGFPDKNKLMFLVGQLHPKDKFLYGLLYHKKMTEVEAAKNLDIAQSSLHEQKKRLIHKLKVLHTIPTIEHKSIIYDHLKIRYTTRKADVFLSYIQTKCQTETARELSITQGSVSRQLNGMPEILEEMGYHEAAVHLKLLMHYYGLFHRKRKK